MRKTNKNYFTDIELQYAVKLERVIYENKENDILSICFRHVDSAYYFVLFRAVGSKLNSIAWAKEGHNPTLRARRCQLLPSAFLISSIEFPTQLSPSAMASPAR